MDKISFNSTVFEALLKRAVIENFEREMSEIPSEDELKEMYAFSDGHQKRMHSLFIKEKAKRYLSSAALFARRAVAVFVVAIALLFGLLMLNADVRAEVGKVIIEWYEKFTSLKFFGEGQSSAEEWKPLYIPDGFEKIDSSKYGVSTSITYANADGVEILFTYSSVQGEFNLSMDSERRELSMLKVNGYEAFIITSLFPDSENGLIWNREGYAFDLWSLLNTDELLKIAESVEPEK